MASKKEDSLTKEKLLAETCPVVKPVSTTEVEHLKKELK
jgi:hypothetical protein